MTISPGLRVHSISATWSPAIPRHSVSSSSRSGNTCRCACRPCPRRVSLIITLADSSNRILWAVVLACHAGAKSFASLTALRVLLGVFESTISPGFTLVTGLWYTPAEHATRTSLWFSGNALGSVFGGLVAYAIAHIKHSLAPWKVGLC